MIELLPNLPYYHASFEDASLPLIVLLCFFGVCGVLRDLLSEDSIWNRLLDSMDSKEADSVYSEIEQM